MPEQQHPRNTALICFLVQVKFVASHCKLQIVVLHKIYTHYISFPSNYILHKTSRALLFLPFGISGASLAGLAGIPSSSVVATHRDSRKRELVAASHLSQTRFSLFGPLLIFTLNLQHGFIPGPQQCLPLQEGQTCRAPTSFISVTCVGLRVSSFGFAWEKSLGCCISDVWLYLYIYISLSLSLCGCYSALGDSKHVKSSRPWKLAFRSSLCCTMHRGQPLARSITASKLRHAMTCSSICLKMPMETRKKTCFCCRVSCHHTEFCELKKNGIKRTEFPTKFQRSKNIVEWQNPHSDNHRRCFHLEPNLLALYILQPSAYLFCHQLPCIDWKR